MPQNKRPAEAGRLFFSYSVSAHTRAQRIRPSPKRGRQPPRVLQPRQMGPHRAAHQHILLKAHGQPIGGKQLLQDVLKAAGRGAEVHDPLRDLMHLSDIVLRQIGDVLRHLRVRGHKYLRRHGLHLLQRFQVPGHVVNKADLVLVQYLPAGQAVRQKHHVVRRPKAYHVEKVPGRGIDAKPLRQLVRRQLRRVALLCQQKLVPQVLGRISAVEKRRLQHRVPGKGAVDSRRVDPAARLSLQIPVPADVVGVGVGVVDRRQLPAVGVQHLPYPPPRVLVVAAVDQADVFLIQPEEADVGGALDVIRPLGKLYQFVHSGIPSVTFCIAIRSCFCCFLVLSSYQFFRLFVMSFYHVLLLLCAVILSYSPASLYCHPIIFSCFFVLSSYHIFLLLCIVILSYFPAKHKRPADSRAPAYLICIWRRWPPTQFFPLFLQIYSCLSAFAMSEKSFNSRPVRTQHRKRP